VVFYASGQQAEVVDFLQRVGRAVAGLVEVTEAELDAERATVITETGGDGVYASCGGLGMRWGPQGLGVADLDHAAVPSLRAQDVHRFARTWLTAGNARLVLNRRPPEDLRLGLPAGPAPDRAPHPEPLPGALPGYGLSTMEGLTASFLVDVDPALRQVVGGVLEETLTRRLRTERGLVYDVSLVSFRVDGTTSSWTVMADPQDAGLDEATLLLHQVLQDLAATGPDPEVLAHVVAQSRSQAASVDGRIGLVLAEAEGDVRGLTSTPWAAVEQRMASVTPEEVRAALAAIVPTLILTVPARVGLRPETEDALQAAGVQPRTAWLTYQGMSATEIWDDLVTDGGSGRGSRLNPAMSSHKGRRFTPWRKIEIWVGLHQVVCLDPQWRVRVEDIALLGTDDDGDVEIVTRQGGVLSLSPGVFRGMAGPWARFLAQVPPEVIRDKPGHPLRAPQ
jgi:hypothetical protein